MFHKCKSDEERKSLFRRLSKRLHPDLGGDSDLMALLLECYEMADRGSFNPQRQSWEDAFSSFAASYASKSPKKKDPDEGFDGKFVHVSWNVKTVSPRIRVLIHILYYAKEHKEFNSKFVKSLVDLYYSRKIDEWLKNKKET
jgi:hypothetical protein